MLAVSSTVNSAGSTVSVTSVPSAAKVEVVVLSDRRCADCSYVSDVVEQLGEVFPGLVSRELDYSSAEGKKVFSDAGLRFLPAILFTDDVKASSGYSDVADYLDEAGKYLSLRIGANYDVACYLDNGSVDCARCANKTECRPEKKNDLQVFIMSDCPYGRQAIEALKPVVDNFGDSITWDVHYIVNEQDGKFSSLHGQYEVDEDIVQLCVKAYSPDELLDYLYCRATNGVKGVDWHICANASGISSIAVKTIEKCVNGSKGMQLLSDDMGIADSLNIGASPTWLANNRYTFGGIDADTVKTNLCRYNTDLKGCDVKLNASTGGLSASGSC